MRISLRTETIMIDRRILLASVASLLGLAAFRWLRGCPAEAAEEFVIAKTEAGGGAPPARSSRPCLRRAADAARPALLHGWLCAGVPSGPPVGELKPPFAPGNCCP